MKEVLEEIESRLGVPAFRDGASEPAKVASSLSGHKLYFPVALDILSGHRAVADDGVVLRHHKQCVDAQPLDVLS